MTLPTKINITNGEFPHDWRLHHWKLHVLVQVLDLWKSPQKNGKNFILDKTGKDSIYDSG